MNARPPACDQDQGRSLGTNEGKSVIKKTLAACGVIVAFAAAGCGASSSGTSAGVSGGSSATPTASPTSAPPAWAAALGPGVTVTGSSTATAGDGSPAGVFLSLLKVVKTGNFSQMCASYEPSVQAKCKSTVGSIPAAEAKKALPTYKNIVPSYTASDGAKALVGSTGTACQPHSTPACSSNTKPAAIFDSGKSFSALWKEAVIANNSSQNTYSLIPFIKVNGTWYLYANGM